MDPLFKKIMDILQWYGESFDSQGWQVPEQAEAALKILALFHPVLVEGVWVTRLFGTEHPKGVAELQEHVRNLRALLAALRSD